MGGRMQCDRSYCWRVQTSMFSMCHGASSNALVFAAMLTRAAKPASVRVRPSLGPSPYSVLGCESLSHHRGRAARRRAAARRANGASSAMVRTRLPGLPASLRALDRPRSRTCKRQPLDGRVQRGTLGKLWHQDLQESMWAQNHGLSSTIWLRSRTGRCRVGRARLPIVT